MSEGTGFRRLAAALAFAYLLVAGAVAVTKPPYGDEGFFAAPSYTLLTRGYLACPPIHELGMDRRLYSIPPMFFLSQAAWYKVVGFGIVRMRLATALWGLAFLIALYLALLRATGENKLALLAAALLGADYTFLMNAAIGRPDMMSAARGMRIQRISRRNSWV